MSDISILNQHVTNLTVQQSLFKDHQEFQQRLYVILDRAFSKIAAGSKKISRLEELKKVYEILEKMTDEDDKKVLQNYIEKTLEDDISIRIVHIISENEGFNAVHDQYNNGHVDIVVESSDLQHKWLGEAKLYAGNKYTQNGLEQLVHDYSKGLPNESGGILIYIDTTQIKSDKIISNWKERLEELAQDDANKLHNLTTLIDPNNASVLHSCHDHHYSNAKYFMKHWCLDLRFN